YEVGSKAQQLIQQLAVSTENAEGFSLQQGIIKFQDRIWIGANSALKTKLISSFHDSAMGGHSGILATYQRVHKLFAWSGLKNDVTEYVQQCD
uniref:Integrase zinc-binding domain-containing protein n=1 Tax=Triticum urartu TaxID=4572 RepID=A0A8R7TT48_TRIUA